MKKVLFTATSNGHLRMFHIPYLKWLKEQGHEVHVAVNCSRGEPIDFIDQTICIPIPRSPFKKEIFSVYKQLKAIIEKNNYDLISCHTPIPSFLTRIAARKARKNGTKVLYTSHGFHFYKGAPVLNWLTFFPVEKILSRYTDAIITINQEDYSNVINKGFKNTDTFLIKGIGLQTEKLDVSNIKSKAQLRNEYGYSETDFILLYIAEFTENKNHRFILDTISALIKEIPHLKVLFAGKGTKLEEIQKMSNALGFSEIINFLGFRNDISNLIIISDLGISVSKREGLPMSILEEMYLNKPIVASDIRGHRDIIGNSIAGYLFKLNEHNSFVTYILKIFFNKELRLEMGKNAYSRSLDFSIDQSLNSMKIIFDKYLK